MFGPEAATQPGETFGPEVSTSPEPSPTALSSELDQETQVGPMSFDVSKLSTSMMDQETQILEMPETSSQPLAQAELGQETQVGPSPFMDPVPPPGPATETPGHAPAPGPGTEPAAANGENALPEYKTLPVTTLPKQNPSFLSKFLDTRPKKILVIGGLCVLFLLLLMSLLGKQKGKPKRKRQAVVKKQGATTEELYQQGLKLFKERKWVEARRIFTLLLGRESDNSIIKNRLAEITMNEQAEAFLLKAKAAMAQGEASKAEILASEIPKDAKYYFEQGQKILRTIKEGKADVILQQVRDLKTGFEKAKSKTKKQKKKKEEIKEKAVKLLDQVHAMVPGYYPVLLLRHQLGAGPKPEPQPGWDENGQRILPRPAVGARTPAVGPDGTAAGNEPGRKHDDSSSGGDGGGGSGVAGSSKQFMAFYRARNFSAAHAELRRALEAQKGKKAKKTQALISKVKKIQALFSRAEAEQHSNSLSSMRAYLKVASLDKSVSRGVHASYIRGKLGKVSLAAAGSAFSRGQYELCYYAVRVAQQNGGAQSQVSRILKQLEDKATQLFKNGYVVKDSNPGRAKAIWRSVTKMVPASSDIHQKAKKYLNEISGKKKEEEL